MRVACNWNAATALEASLLHLLSPLCQINHFFQHLHRNGFACAPVHADIQTFLHHSRGSIRCNGNNPNSLAFGPISGLFHLAEYFGAFKAVHLRHVKVHQYYRAPGLFQRCHHL